MPSFIATAPDGRKWRVDAPEGMPADKISAEVDAAWKSQKPKDYAAEGAKHAAMEEPNPNLVAVGHAMAAPFEGASQLFEHLRGKGAEADKLARSRAQAMGELHTEHPLTRPVETATDIATLGVLPALRGATPLGRVLAGAGTGAAYGAAQPVTGKDFASEKAKQIAAGGAAGAVPSAILEAKSIVPKLTAETKVLPKLGPRGEGAEKVTSELQRQRDVMSGKKGVPEGGSEYERVKKDFEERMTPLKDAALKSGGRIETAPTMQVIENLKLKNPDAQVQRALTEVQKTIKRATKGASTADLPAAGTKLKAADLKALQGRGSTLDMDMADEVRQSINRLINQTGEKALSKHTKDLLIQVRDHLMKNAPQEYRAWLDAEAKGRQELERFEPESTVLGKTTSDARAANALQGSDAQRKLNSIFGGEHSTRDLGQLVEMTKHDPVAGKGLRSAYKDWLVQVNSIGQIETAKMLDRWRDSKDAVQKSGMLDPQHFADLDKMMEQLKAAALKKGIAKQVGNMLGWFTGGGYRGAFLGREIGAKATERIERDLERKAVELASEQPEVARLMNEPQTPENIQRLERLLSVAGGRAASKSEPPKLPRRSPNPLGMRPAGL